MYCTLTGLHGWFPSCFGPPCSHVHRAGGLCVIDEVQTGFGRGGEFFWIFQSQGHHSSSLHVYIYTPGDMYVLCMHWVGSLLQTELWTYANWKHYTYTCIILASLLWSVWIQMLVLIYIVNPRHACAARVTVLVLSLCVSVCLSVCLSVSTLILHYRLRGGLLAISAASETREPEKYQKVISWNDCIRDICRENKWKSQYT